ncbi:MAG: hypothetical protein KIT56_01755 [Gammaproteobacteria bacterium]|nr:hypothetical protein [Gammaproteobacteria bacterium]MCW5582609.1 hypothetical protein [Gammaproteobacteria bacterium]
MLAKLLYGYKATQCLYVAAKFNIADHLKNGPKSVKKLASLTNSDADSLYRAIRCLVALGVFQQEGTSFALNSASEDLLSDAENTIKDFVILCGEELYQAAGNLLYTVQTGKPAFNHIYGISHWEYLEANPDKAKIFHDAMESALEYTKELGIRCTVLTGNFFECVPTADLYLLKVVLHDWDDQHAKMILMNCHKSMPYHGKLLIIEKIIEDNQYKDMACLGDINMMVTLSGRERNLVEFIKLLNQSGFEFTRKIDTSCVFSIIEAKLK